MPMHQLIDLALRNQRVLIREDFNVPLHAGKITSDTRLKAALPTIRHALQAGAKVMLMSHLGRPQEGSVNPELSLAPIAQRLSELLKQRVTLVPDWLKGVEPAAGEIVLFENVRFQVGEKTNDQQLAKKIAALCDIFVMDAFATSHRAEASTYGVAEFAPRACAGPLLVSELTALAKVLAQPVRPLLAIVGGAKVSSKLIVLESLFKRVDQIILGGGIANTFLAAQGYLIGRSLYEPDLIPEAQRLMVLAKSCGVTILLAEDVVTATEFAATAVTTVKSITQVTASEMIFDIGPAASASFAKVISAAGTILWNGPLGAFELKPFSQGTAAIAQEVANSKGFSVAGGGDTLAAIEEYKVASKISYISTGGGAFLEFIEGKTLPAIAILESRYLT